MIIHSSAIVAIVLKENNYENLVQKILSTNILRIGAVTLLEATIVLTHRLQSDTRTIIRDLIDEFEIEVIPFGQEHYSCAMQAFLNYGKGRNKAALNFGDCLSYSFAMTNREPLLFIGNDFSKTDVIKA